MTPAVAYSDPLYQYSQPPLDPGSAAALAISREYIPRALETPQYSRPSATCRVYVGNLSYEVSWQDLKDHMSQAGYLLFLIIFRDISIDAIVGEVLHADILMNENRRSKGCGIVEYADPRAADYAIAHLSNTSIKGRHIFVREDRIPHRR
jgi:RNA recognition motif-containing protein